jgi:glycosyltransferase involved in cell wall biosynthesis
MSRAAVIIPVRNGATTIRRAIDSALEQENERPEVIVVDDGSTDATPRILGSYGDQIKVLRQANRGPSAARNAGAAAASPDAKYFAFLDADDVWLPNMLGKMVAKLDAASWVVLSFCDVITVDDDDREVGTNFIDEYSAHAPTMDELLTRWWPILTSAAVMRRSAFERSGGFDESFTRPGFEDPYMWLVMREQGDFAYVPQRLVRYRTTPPVERMLKYAKGYRIFGRLVSERYGDAGQRLIRESSNAFVSAWGYAGLVALREGDKLRARRAFACALSYGPFQVRAASRWLRTFLPMSVVRALSGRIVRGERTKPELENYFR